MSASLELLAYDNLNSYKLIRGDNLKTHARHASLDPLWQEPLAEQCANAVIIGFCQQDVSMSERTWLH